MLAKYWRRIGFVILVIACLVNITLKLINKYSLNKEMIYSATLLQDQDQAIVDNNENQNSDSNNDEENNSEDNEDYEKYNDDSDNETSDDGNNYE